jgi:hypothetical protein
MEPLGIWIPTAFDFADSAPVDRRGVAVLFVARDNAAFATNAAGHVEVKAILLAAEKIAGRNARDRNRERDSAARRVSIHGTGPRRHGEMSVAFPYAV